MPIKDFALSEMQILHNTKIKVYPDGSTNITYCKKPIFRADYTAADVKRKAAGLIPADRSISNCVK